MIRYKHLSHLLCLLSFPSSWFALVLTLSCSLWPDGDGKLSMKGLSGCTLAKKTLSEKELFAVARGCQLTRRRSSRLLIPKNKNQQRMIHY